MQLRALLLPALAAALAAAGCSRAPANAASEGQKALRAGDYEQAAVLLRAATKSNAQNADVFYNLGMAYLLSSHNRPAEEAFDRAVALSRDTDDWAPLVARAETRRRRGNAEGAVNDYQAALGKANRLPALVAGLAACEMDRGNAGTARALLEEALTTDPEEPVALYNSAVLGAADRASDSTYVSDLLVRFLVTRRSEAYPEQRADAVRRLAALAAARPPELQDKIDALLMASARAASPAFALDRAVEAFRLDQSNPVALARMVAAARECRNEPLAETLLVRGRLLFPNDRRFQ